MIDIQLEEHSDGRYSASALIGAEFVTVDRVREPVETLAREIAARHIPDQPWRVLFDDGTGRLRKSGISIYRMAKLTVEESSTGLHRRTWRTYPRPGVTCQDCGEAQFMFKGRCMGCLEPSSR